MTKNEESLGDLWDTIKRNSVNIIGIPVGKEREKGVASTFKRNNR